MQTLADHIKTEWGGSQAAFARAQNVKPPQVTQWITKGFVVIDQTLFSPRRDLKCAIVD